MNAYANGKPLRNGDIVTAGLWRKVGAEMVGTFALVFAGCGAIMANELTGGAVTHVGISLTFGLVIMVMIYATGHISAAHFNPAVTIAFATRGYFPWRETPAFVGGQFLAATAAALLLRATIGSQADVGATAPAGLVMQSVAFEFILTFFLMFVITAVATDGRVAGGSAGLAIGGTVALCAMFGGPISGASMNPARSLGPALASGAVAHLWIYFLGPISGAIAGAWAYDQVRCGSEPNMAKGCC